MSGSVNNTAGEVEEEIGNVTGLRSSQMSGKNHQAEGDAERKQAEAQRYVVSTINCIASNAESVAGSLTGDATQEISGVCFVFPHPRNPAGN